MLSLPDRIAWYACAILAALAIVVALTSCHRSQPEPNPFIDIEQLCEETIQLCGSSGHEGICHAALACVDLRDQAAHCRVDLERCQGLWSVDEQECLGEKRALADAVDKARRQRWAFAGGGAVAAALTAVLLFLFAG